MKTTRKDWNEARAREAILVALDVPTGSRAMQLASELEGHVGGFKIGMELFYSEGPSVVERIGARRTFLDLKLHDIPNTVASASRALARLGVGIFNFHCLGGLDMMKAGAHAAREVDAQTKVIGVTILTSHDRLSLARLGLDQEPRDAVRRLALLAREAGLDGVVCSPQEIEAVKAECGEDFLLVTPGIRPAGSESGDQKRTLSPREAIERGADYLVIGRPITAAADPAQAARSIFG
jgi:orotidine-5'-phosphate decarboxylase